MWGRMACCSRESVPGVCCQLPWPTVPRFLRKISHTTGDIGGKGGSSGSCGSRSTMGVGNAAAHCASPAMRARGSAVRIVCQWHFLSLKNARALEAGSTGVACALIVWNCGLRKDAHSLGRAYSLVLRKPFGVTLAGSRKYCQNGKIPRLRRIPTASRRLRWPRQGQMRVFLPAKNRIFVLQR